MKEKDEKNEKGNNEKKHEAIGALKWRFKETQKEKEIEINRLTEERRESTESDCVHMNERERERSRKKETDRECVCMCKKREKKGERYRERENERERERG